MISPRPATISDVLALCGVMPGRHARALALQAHRSEILAIEDCAGLACLMGFYPLGERRGVARFELWLLVRVGGVPAPVILAIARLARSTFRARAQNGAVMVVASVQPGWAPGRRLARLAGMRRWPARGRLERYGWRNG